MFTGIIQSNGLIKKIEPLKKDARVTIVYEPKKLGIISLGDSICVNGICLTVQKKQKKQLVFHVSEETLNRTILFKEKSQVNLECSLLYNGKISGHFLTGHVDGVGKITEIKINNACWILEIKPPKKLLKFIAEKGSIAINGVSLTVNLVQNDKFKVNIIPFTLKETNLEKLIKNSEVNIEIDLISRYIENIIKRK
ncbi:MAG: riboflavin synthase [Candidatus Methylopumilus sp.]|nr:riboflavin synthase [Candidatus Methylopumilus sp.]